MKARLYPLLLILLSVHDAYFFSSLFVRFFVVCLRCVSNYQRCFESLSFCFSNPKKNQEKSKFHAIVHVIRKGLLALFLVEYSSDLTRNEIFFGISPGGALALMPSVWAETIKFTYGPVIRWSIPTKSIICVSSFKPSPCSITVSKTDELVRTAQVLLDNIDSIPDTTAKEGKASHLHTFLESFRTKLKMDTINVKYHELEEFFNANLSASLEETSGGFTCHLISNNYFTHQAPSRETGLQTASLSSVTADHVNDTITYSITLPT